MARKDAKKRFQGNISRGRKFEQSERSYWEKKNIPVEVEAPTEFEGKRGRIDILLKDTEEGHTIVVEIKASNWDKMKAHRVRPNALSHARQIWRYIEGELGDQDVIPAIVYPKTPQAKERKVEIEEILDEQGIQVVWRDDELGTLREYF